MSPAASTIKFGDNLTLTDEGNGVVRVDAAQVAAPPPSTISIVTVAQFLALTPTDGMQTIVVDSLTAPNWAWKFQYSAGISDAYKWLFVGGSDYYGSEGSNGALTASMAYLSGADWVAPLAGHYSGGGMAKLSTSTTGGAQGFMSIGVPSGSASISGTAGATNLTAGSSGNNGHQNVLYAPMTWRATGATRGAILRLQAFASPVGGSATGHLFGRPTRVSQA